MEVDYDVYAEGEALLGWLNCTAHLSSKRAFNGNEVLRQLAGELQRRLNTHSAEVAHLKMTLNPDEGLGDLAVINLVRNDLVPELSQELAEPLNGGQLIINLRAEASPEILRDVVEAAIKQCARQNPKLTAKLEHLEHFCPGKPTPTYRIAAMPSF